MTESLVSPVQDLLIVHNHFCSDQDRVHKVRESLTDYAKAQNAGTPNIVPSERDLEGTIDMLRANVGPDTRIIALMGDGGFHNLTRAHSELKLDNDLTIAAGGGAGDSAHMLHPLRYHRYSPHSLLNSPSLKHRPLEIVASHPDLAADDSKTKIQAVGYFSIGFSADQSDGFNQPEFRDKIKGKGEAMRFYYQSREILSHLKDSRQFVVSDIEEGQVVKARKLTDLVFPNGQRMAKVVHFSGIRLLEHSFGRLEVADELNRRTLGKVSLQAALGLYDKYDPEKKVSFKINPVNNYQDTFFVQADGEAYEYPSGTIFTVGLSSNTLPLVTTDLRYQQETPIAA